MRKEDKALFLKQNYFAKVAECNDNSVILLFYMSTGSGTTPVLRRHWQSLMTTKCVKDLSCIH